MSDETCKAALNIAGEHYPCDWPTDANGRHDGWAHTNKAAEAIWASDRDPVPGMPGWETFAATTDQRATGREREQG